MDYKGQNGRSYILDLLIYSGFTSICGRLGYDRRPVTILAMVRSPKHKHTRRITNK